MHFTRTIAAATVAAIGLLIASTSAASAEPSSDITFIGSNVGIMEGVTVFGGTWYGFDADDACRSQYNAPYVVAGSLDVSNASTILCWTPESVATGDSQDISVGSGDVSVTVGHSGSVTYRALGGVDVLRWCDTNHPGSGATALYNSANWWFCIK